MPYHCPHCRATVLSRRNKLCSHCHEPLPAAVVFTPGQVRAIEAEEAARTQAAQRRAEEKQIQQSKSRNSGDGGGGWPIGC